MDIRIEGKKVEEGSVMLEVRVAEKELASLERGAYLVAAQRNGIDVGGEGTPRQIVERALTEPRATALAQETLKRFVAPFALSADGGDYSVVGAPRFDDGVRIDGNGDLLFRAEWTRLPPLELSSYDPVEVAVPSAAPTEAEVDARMDEIAATYKTVERDKTRSAVEDGAIIQISMECRKDGRPFPQLCFSDRLYRAGSQQMPEGFDAAIQGARVGDEVEVDFTLPMREELDGTVTGPAITGKVKVEAIMKEVDRVLTDEFVAQNIPQAGSLAELREQTRRELEQGKAQQMRHHRNFLVADELAKRLQGSIPDAAYDAVVDQMMESLREQAAAQHTTAADLLQREGATEEQYRMMALMQARGQLRQGAALDAWARHWGLSLADEDMDEFFASSGQEGERMRAEIEQGGYRYLAREGALRLKAGDHAAALAVVREGGSMPASPQGAGA